MSTQSSDFVFEPKVWSDHIMAYFNQTLVFGAFALRNNELQAEGKGVTVNFPYYKAIGAAEEIEENEALQVDKLSDDSFTCTVFEIGKAVGFKKKAFKKSADSADRIMAEAQRQIARRHAEKVDDKLIAEILTAGEDGFTATDATGTMNVRTQNTGKIVAFGDRADEAAVHFIHSLQLLDLMNDSTSGFMKADANDPMYNIKGFKGRMMNGMAIVVNDKVPSVAPIASKKSFKSIICKENAYGIIMKQEMEMDSDKDILNREYIVTGNEWYGVKNFHAKISSEDKKIAFVTTATSIAA